MEITEERLTDRRARLVLKGRLNAVSAPALEAHLKAMATNGQVQITLDLAGVSFIDSSGLAALVSGLKLAREHGGALKLSGLTDQTMTVFKLTMLDRVFEIYPDAQAAMNAWPAT